MSDAAVLNEEAPKVWATSRAKGLVDLLEAANFPGVETPDAEICQTARELLGRIALREFGVVPDAKVEEKAQELIDGMDRLHNRGKTYDEALAHHHEAIPASVRDLRQHERKIAAILDDPDHKASAKKLAQCFTVCAGFDRARAEQLKDSEDKNWPLSAEHQLALDAHRAADEAHAPFQRDFKQAQAQHATALGIHGSFHSALDQTHRHHQIAVEGVENFLEVAQAHVRQSHMQVGAPLHPIKLTGTMADNDVALDMLGAVLMERYELTSTPRTDEIGRRLIEGLTNGGMDDHEAIRLVRGMEREAQKALSDNGICRS